MEFTGKSLIFLLAIVATNGHVLLKRFNVDGDVDVSAPELLEGENSFFHLRNESRRKRFDEVAVLDAADLDSLDFTECITDDEEKEPTALLEETIRKYYENMEFEMTTVYGFSNDVFDDIVRFTDLIDSCNRTEISTLKMVEELREMNIRLPKNFPEEINGTEVSRALEKIVTYLTNVSDWYQFVEAIHYRLSEYEYHKNRDIFKDTDLYQDCANEVPFTLDTLRTFLNVVDSKGWQRGAPLGHIYKDLENVELNELRAQAICELVKQQVESTVTTSCLEGGVMQVKGSIVKTSDISLKACPGDLKVLEIFALNTVYLDQDLDVTDKKLQVAISAPNWEIVGEQSCYGAMSHYEWSSEFKQWLCKPGDDNEKSLYWFMRCENPMLKEYTEKYSIYCGEEPEEDPTEETPELKTLCNLDGQIKPLTDPSTCSTTVVPKSKNGGLAFVYEFMQKQCPRGINDFCQLRNRRKRYFDPLKNVIKKYVSSSPISRVVDLSGGPVDQFPKMKFTKNRAPGLDGAAGSPGQPGNRGGVFMGIGQEFHGMDKFMVVTDGGRGGVGEMGAAGRAGEGNRKSRGGDGGKGGKGGRAGHVTFLKVEKPNHPKIETQLIVHSSDGKEGMGGFGGWPGGASILNPYQPRYLVGQIGTNTVNWTNPEEPVEYRSLPLIVNDFKRFILENADNYWEKYFTFEMYRSLSLDDHIAPKYKILDYVTELINLERAFATYGTTEFIPFYETFGEAVENYIQTLGDSNKEEKKIGLYLQAAATSKLCALREESKGSLVVQLRKYLDNIINDINKLEQTETAVAIRKYNQDYEKGMNHMIAEADKLIHEVMLPQINEILAQIDQQIDGLLMESSDVQSKIVENRRAVKRVATLRNICIILNGMTGVITLFTKSADRLNTAARSTLPAIQNLLPVIEKNEVPKGVYALIKDTTPYLTSIRNQKKVILEELLEDISKDTTGLLLDTKNAMTNVKDNIKIVSKNGELEQVKKLLDEKEVLLVNEAATDSTREALDLLRSVKWDLQVAEQIPNSFLKHKQNPITFGALKEIVRGEDDESDKDVKALKDYQEKFYQIIVPMLNNMRADVPSIVKDLNSESLAALDVVRNRLTTMIKNTASKLDQYTLEFKLKESIARWVQNLEETTNTVINIYERKQSYIEHLKLASYIAQVNSPDLQNIPTTDKALENALRELRLIIQSNILLGHQQKAVAAFKQYVFPFADVYLNAYVKNIETLELSIRERTQKAAEQVRDLKSKLDNSDALFEQYREYIRTADFDDRTRRSNGPFYTWTNETHADTLSELLMGRKVILQADLANGFDGNAVRFSKIGIKFVPADETLQQSDLDRALEVFDAHITHLGNSYYKCDDQCYVMASRNVTIKYSFQVNDAGKPVDNNEAYEVIGEGDYMLSPYASWVVRLRGRSLGDFRALRTFRNRVNLQLQGRGKYVERENDICKNNRLNMYYQETSCDYK